ncbi:MAG: hypothetical protein V7L25_20070 [Nostoc sp.]|uniref:hypothetical protein n=1 Tax=Nostoc sp. TaxID=1180 RepID=UPI002FF42641
MVYPLLLQYLSRLGNAIEAILQAKGITIFARIDQRVEAKKVGLSLRPTQLLLFGNLKPEHPSWWQNR